MPTSKPCPKLDASNLPMEDRLALSCGIAGLALLKCVAREKKVAIGKITPALIESWAVNQWQAREAAAGPAILSKSK